MSLTTQDKIDITELCSRYAQATDHGDVEAWMSAWTDDGEMDATMGKAKGAAELRALETRLQAGFSKGKRHVVANLVIDGNGHQASATSYLIVFDREKPGVVATATYEDVLQRVDGAWKFSRRTLRTDGTSR